MNYKKVLITGGAGFVGSNISFKLKQDYPSLEVIIIDNLNRRGSKLNLPKLKQEKIKFIKGDVRSPEDIKKAGKIDLLIECSAECSVLAGYNSSVKYLIDTNLGGAINCLEVAKENEADFVFLSTSRVYPIQKLNKLNLATTETRFDLKSNQSFSGVSTKGISERFPLDGYRSFYGATKLSAELIIQEYIKGYGVKGFINRCGVIAGPWQMGKVDQGFLSLWVASHIFDKKLNYIGFGGKQVRDVLHVDDLYNLLKMQIENIDKCNGETYNIGGGIKNSTSLLELTSFCQKIVGKKIDIGLKEAKREVDIPYYVTDFSKVSAQLGWLPVKTIEDTVKDTASWILENKQILKGIFK